MKRFTRNIAILIAPFLLMILINEIVRPTIEEESYSKHGITAINSVDNKSAKCTWICHNNTTYCKENHVMFLKPYFQITDTLYFGMIGKLLSTGNYGLANIIFLVVLVPLFIWFFIIKSMNIQDEIKKLKHKQ